MENDKTKKELESLIDDTSDAIGVTDLDGFILKVNHAFEIIYGWTAAEAVGRKLPMVPPHLIPEAEGLINEVVRGRKVTAFETVRQRKDKRLIDVSLTLSPIRDPSQNVVALAGISRDITDRKRLMNALRQSEEKYRDLYESAHDVILLVDKDSNIVDINPRGELLTGYTRSELLEMNLLRELVVQEDREEIRRVVHSATLGRETIYEVRWQTKDERIIHFEGATTSRKSEKGEFLYTRCILRDVTARKHVEEQLREHTLQLRETEERFRTIFDKASAGIALMAIDGTFLKVNERFCDIVGYSEEELLKLHWQEITHPPGVKTGQDKVRKALNGEIKFFSFEKGYVKKDGSLVWVHLTASLLRSQTGEPRYFISIIDDITHRKQADEKIREQAELLEVAQETIIVRDLENRVLYWNRSAEDKYGWTKNEALGTSLPDLLFRGDQFQSQNARKALLRDGKWEGQLHPFSKDNKELIVDSRWTLVRDDHGDPKAILTVCTDVTEKRKIEERLLHIQRMESIGTLAGGIAHDFNNVLGIILAYGSLLQRGKFNPGDLKEYTDAMMKAAERGSGLVKQILMFARKSDISVESVQVNYVIKELIDMLHQTFPKTIRFCVDLDKSLPIISIDSGQLNQVLMNLCVNARDAILEASQTGKMQSIISIRTATVSGTDLQRRLALASAGEYVSISVSDAGTGMDEKTKQRIFEPFFTTKEQGKGTGLGLAVVYGVVQSHGGLIDLESELGKGATFTLYFPVPKDVSAGPKTETEEVEEALGGSETILVVEDEEALRMLMKNLLQAKGYAVIMASDGLESVETFEKNKERISLVISDHGLPGMNGADAVKRMIAAKSGLKCIVASGYIEPNEKSQLFKSGVKEFIQKPYDPIEVVRKVREVLDMK